MALSYSQLRQYRVCPRQYEYAVIKKLPRRISPEESFGASVHNCLKRWGELEGRETAFGSEAQARRENGKWKTENGQLELFNKEKEINNKKLTFESLLEFWHQSFIVDTYETRIEADFHRKRGEELMRKFFEWWSREEREVVAVEKGFSLSFDGTQLKGRIDRVEKFRIQNLEFRIKVIDFKTTSPCSQKEVDADLQLSIYALAVSELFSQPCEELVLLFLSEENVVERSTVRVEGQLRDAKKHIMNIKQRIEEKDFHPTPGTAVCRRCPFKGVCDVAAI